MPGPTPISAPYRLIFKYTVASLQHKHQNYCDVVPSGDSSGYDLVGVNGSANVPLSQAVTRFFDVFAPFYDPTDTTFDGWELQQRSGTTFVFVAAGTTSVVPTASGAYSPANGFCVSGKDALNRRFNRFVYEGQFGPTNKNSSYSSMSTNYKHVADYFYDAGNAADPNDAYFWALARGNVAGKRFLANVIDSNEKLRRIRHIK